MLKVYFFIILNLFVNLANAEDEKALFDTSYTLDQIKYDENSEAFKIKIKHDIFFSSRYKLAESVEKGEDGVDEILFMLDSHLKTSRSPTSINIISYSVSALHELIRRGIKTDKMLCGLLRTINIQFYFPTKYKTAEAIKEFTGIDTGFDKDFTLSYSGDKESIASYNNKLSRWESFANCTP